MRDMFKPIAWRVANPIALPEITAKVGHVFPLVIACTLDQDTGKYRLRRALLMKYCYIVTKPFKGTIKATATIYSKPFGSEHKITKEIYIDIG
jgi:hypothetical protein